MSFSKTRETFKLCLIVSNLFTKAGGIYFLDGPNYEMKELRKVDK